MALSNKNITRCMTGRSKGFELNGSMHSPNAVLKLHSVLDCSKT